LLWSGCIVVAKISGVTVQRLGYRNFVFGRRSHHFTVDIAAAIMQDYLNTFPSRGSDHHHLAVRTKKKQFAILLNDFLDE